MTAWSEGSPTTDVAEMFRARRHAPPVEVKALEADLAVRFLPMAARLARRYVGRGIDSDDLEQVAGLALVKAIRRFDPDLGSFEAYSGAFIRGELKKHFRDHGWMVRPPRRIQDLQARISRAGEGYDPHGASAASVSRLALQLDVGRPEILEALAARGCFTPWSLDTTDRPDGQARGESIAAGGDDFDEVDRRSFVDLVCRDLSAEDRRLLFLRFVEEMTQRQIAADLGMSQMQVSRRLVKVLEGLRTRAIGGMAA